MRPGARRGQEGWGAGGTGRKSGTTATGRAVNVTQDETPPGGAKGGVANEANALSRHVSPLAKVHAFVLALMTEGADGRVLVTKIGGGKEGGGGGEAKVAADPEQSSFKFLLLNPAVHFKQVVDEAHSIILAGGTMEPVSEMISQLFPHVPDTKIQQYSCGHIIPPENLLTTVFHRGPVGQADLEFTYLNRMKAETMDALGTCVNRLL